MSDHIPMPPTVGEGPPPNVVSIARHADYVAPALPIEGPPVLHGYFDEGRRCWHSQFVVDHHARKVRCKDCKVALDPIDCLQKLCHYDWTYLAAELKRMQTEHARLKDEVTKIRAARATCAGAS